MGNQNPKFDPGLSNRPRPGVSRPEKARILLRRDPAVRRPQGLTCPCPEAGLSLAYFAGSLSKVLLQPGEQNTYVAP